MKNDALLGFYFIHWFILTISYFVSYEDVFELENYNLCFSSLYGHFIWVNGLQYLLTQDRTRNHSKVLLQGYLYVSFRSELSFTSSLIVCFFLLSCWCGYDTITPFLKSVVSKCVALQRSTKCYFFFSLKYSIQYNESMTSDLKLCLQKANYYKFISLKH